jgi:hypothetical protein
MSNNIQIFGQPLHCSNYYDSTVKVEYLWLKETSVSAKKRVMGYRGVKLSTLYRYIDITYPMNLWMAKYCSKYARDLYFSLKLITVLSS